MPSPRPLSPRFPAPSAAALAVALSLGPGHGPAAAQQATPAAAPAAPALRDQRLSFRLDWGPAQLARIDLRLLDDGARRVAEAQGAPEGVGGVFADFELRQRGEIRADGARRFDARSRFGDEASTRAVRWGGPDAAAEVLDAGPPPEAPLTPIPPGEMSGAVSPAEAALAMLDQAAAGEGCGGLHRMFDGVRRLNMTVIDEGPDRLEADRDWTYSGPAHRCRIRFERIGGFPAEDDDAAAPPARGRGDRDGPSGFGRSRSRTAESDYDRLLWLAPLPGGMAPVRLRIEWPLGYVTARIDLGE
ncbi:MAG: hypothetical protein VYD87_22545 [Pseudomonadota bacterium]|nr:hypothetical protein [Pseudomonadota bacterium]